MTCTTCLYFEPMQQGHGFPSGWCHRYPPVVLGDAPYDQRRPTVKTDDWCGEWRTHRSDD